MVRTRADDPPPASETRPHHISSTNTMTTETSQDYRDYANESEAESLLALAKMKTSGSSTTTSTTEQNFPMKLHYMLSDMEADGLSHAVSWQPHGRCFIVHNPKEFAEKILPLWFRQTKYSSFQRQLNLYGFKRITKGPDKGAHYHELFLRGKRHLAHRIPRVKIKGTGARRPANPDEEPNFYKKPFLPPTHVKPKISSSSGNFWTAAASLPQPPPQALSYVMTPGFQYSGPFLPLLPGLARYPTMPFAGLVSVAAMTQPTTPPWTTTGVIGQASSGQLRDGFAPTPLRR